LREPDGWIDLSDFRPGIVHNLGWNSIGSGLVGSAPAPDGAASMENTFRCIAIPSGGLGPLPVQDWTYSRPSLSASVPNWKVQLFVNGPIGAVGSMLTGLFDPRSLSTTHLVDFYLSVEGIVSGTNRATQWLQDRVRETGPTLTAGHTTVIENVNAAASNLTNFSAGQMTAHYLTHTTGTMPVVVRNYQSVDGSVGSGLAAFPDPASTSVEFVFGAPFNASVMGPPLSHQGRIVLFTDNFFGTGLKRPNDFFFMTVPQGVAAESSTASVVTQDSLTGIGVAASISASDLLVITHTKGAALIQGDVVNPTVRRMPGVVSTDGAMTIGVQTPAGFVYGVNRGGIYAWVGESSQLLSPQLPDDFWVVGNGNGIINHMGRFELWNDWVMCPNNWVYDIALGSWWRIEDPSVFAAYEWQQNPYNGYVYGNAPVWTDGGSTMSGYIRGFNRNVGAHSWSWQSQPLARTRNRVVEVRDVDLACQGAGTVAVTFTARDGTTATNTYTLSGSTTLTQYLRATFAVQGTDVKVKMVATGTGGAGVAPVVHSLHIGYSTRMHLGVG
jgi:hypothetical protein